MGEGLGRGCKTKGTLNQPFPTQYPSMSFHSHWEIPPTLHHKMTEIARQLRQTQTPTEAILWQHLRRKQRGYKVRRQQPIGIFIVDFYIPSAHLIIEIDGSIHALQANADQERQTILEQLGLQFLRFTPHQIKNSLPQVLQTIDETASTLLHF
jgi:very-short-patch-repair endonuclease